MKVSAIHAYVLEAVLAEPFAYSRAWYASRASMLIRIETDQGLVGWGESYGPARINAAIVRNLAPFLIGQDALASDWIWQELYARFRDHGQKGSIIQAISGIDIALWDLKGKFFDQPIYRLMGGPMRTEVKAYATGLYRRESGQPEQYLAEEASSYVESGFGAVKVKVGFGVEEDVRVTRAIRRAIGPETGLMIDANHAYDVVAAIRLGRQLEEFDIGWFEEPVPPEDIMGHREVRSKLNIPIASGECEFTRYGFRELITTRAVDYVQPDTCSAGGLSECKKIADMAGAYGIRYVPHVWGSGIATAAALQLLAVLPSLTPPSLNRIEPMLEFDCTSHPVREAILSTPIRPQNGIVAIPSGPGLGVQVEQAAIDRFCVDI
jgi:D-galactarolactone cycloisomerase